MAVNVGCSPCGAGGAGGGGPKLAARSGYGSTKVRYAVGTVYSLCTTKVFEFYTIWSV